MKKVRVVITDLPHLTGYLDGSDYKARRQTSDPNQQTAYESGYRKGAKDTCKKDAAE